MKSPSASLAEIDKRMQEEKRNLEFQEKVIFLYDHIMRNSETSMFKAEATAELTRVDAPTLQHVVSANENNLSEYSNLLSRLEDRLDSLDSTGSGKEVSKGEKVPATPGFVGQLYDQSKWLHYNNSRLEKLLSRLEENIG